MRLETLTLVHAGLADLSNATLPAKTAFKIARAFKKTTSILEHHDTVMRELINKYAVKDEDGKPQMTEDGTGVMLEDGDALHAERQELLDTEIDDFDFTINIDDITVEVTPETLTRLDAILEE